MGNIADNLRKAFRILAAVAVFGGVVYLGYNVFYLKIGYALLIGAIAGVMTYVLLSGYSPPESVKRVLRILFAVLGGVVVGYVAYNQGYDIKFVVAGALIVFIVLAVLLEKGKGAGGED